MWNYENMIPAKVITTSAAERIKSISERLIRTSELESWSSEEQGKQALDALAEIIQLASDTRRELAVWTVKHSEYSANKVAGFAGVSNKTVNAWVKQASESK